MWIENGGRRWMKAYGKRAIDPVIEANDIHTVYDMASLTKVLATTPSIMRLYERGRIELDAPVCRYIPEFSGEGREKITVRNLLTHTSGLRPGLSSRGPWTDYRGAIEAACQEKPTHPPGTLFRYSDINFIVLGEIVQRVSGMPLNIYAEKHFYRPMGMRHTGYLPAQKSLPMIAPTEHINEGVLRGVVHDPVARRMGGVAGHAGLFSDVADVACFARMMLHQGRCGKVRIFKPETVQIMTAIQNLPGLVEKRGLGWDIDTGYSRPRGKLFPIGSYGHTGFTGGCMWIDPVSETFYVLLTNRVHPDGKGNILDLQASLGTLVAEVVGFNSAGQ
jgi:CubicO group peptidase (beta-lactamase class C family)